MKNQIFIPALVSLMFLLQNGNAQIPAGLKTGYGFSPVNFPNYPAFVANMPAFYSDVANSTTCNGGIVFGNTLWYDTYNTAGQVPGLSQNIAGNQPSPYSFSDMHTFVVSSTDSVYMRLPGQWSPNNFSNSLARSKILDMLKTFAINFQPDQVFLGNEMNFYLVKDSADYINFKTLLAQAYDTIKFYSPNTKVGTVFNYEHLAGKGALNGWLAPHWNALTDLDTSKLDIIGITVYPFFNHPHANLVPASYLNALSQKTGNKKIVITETGWPADSTLNGAPWACSPTEQVDYVNKLFDSIIPSGAIASVNWLFLNYLMSNDPSVLYFKSISMRDSTGNDRPALQALLSKCVTTPVQSNDENEKSSLVYPNPADNLLYVPAYPANEIKTIFVTDLQGKIILSQQLTSPKPNALDISLLEKGIYLYTITEKKKFVQRGKFIKL